MKKYLVYVVVLVVLGSVFLFQSVRETLFPVAEIKDAVQVSDADYDVKLKGINVADANLKDFKGKRVLFLNFWGTWCPPCRAEWPSIEALYKQKKDKMDFVLIAMLDEQEAVRKFVAENQYTAPVYIAESPINGKILPKVFPTTFILHQNGQILQKETSSKDWNSDSVHRFLDNFLK